MPARWTHHPLSLNSLRFDPLAAALRSHVPLHLSRRLLPLSSPRIPSPQTALRTLSHLVPHSRRWYSSSCSPVHTDDVWECYGSVEIDTGELLGIRTCLCRVGFGGLVAGESEACDKLRGGKARFRLRSPRVENVYRRHLPRY